MFSRISGFRGMGLGLYFSRKVSPRRIVKLYLSSKVNPGDPYACYLRSRKEDGVVYIPFFSDTLSILFPSPISVWTKFTVAGLLLKGAREGLTEVLHILTRFQINKPLLCVLFELRPSSTRLQTDLSPTC
jgi:hypothetical protein